MCSHCGYTYIIIALPPPNVTITPSRDNTAGHLYNLTCTSTVIGNLVVSQTLEWLIDEQPISNSSDIMVKLQASGVTSSLILMFTPLSSSHAGQYTCRARIDIPTVGITKLDGMESVNLNVSGK